VIVAINEWWADDPEQKYWMEATRRPIVGEDVRAPTAGTKGQVVWSYELVRFAKPGDIVFHWRTNDTGDRRLIGWSEVTGIEHLEDDLWAPQTSPDEPVMKPHWVVPLGGLHEFAVPVRLNDVRAHQQEVLGVASALIAEYGDSIYFPFNGHGSDPLRAFQGYFTKFPRELVEVLGQYFDLSVTTHPAEPEDLEMELSQVAAKIAGSAASKKSGGQGFMRDVRTKLAVEQHAVEMAVALYKSLGAKNISIKGAPYDILLMLEGEEVHVEVKGSGHALDAVWVTPNEVHHAHDHLRTELIVVDTVQSNQADDGTVTTTGGALRRWINWKPAPDSLIVRTYKHTLPEPEVTG
jgi:hypothetical protein